MTSVLRLVSKRGRALQHLRNINGIRKGSGHGNPNKDTFYPTAPDYHTALPKFDFVKEIGEAPAYTSEKHVLHIFSENIRMSDNHIISLVGKFMPYTGPSVVLAQIDNWARAIVLGFIIWIPMGSIAWFWTDTHIFPWLEKRYIDYQKEYRQLLREEIKQELAELKSHGGHHH